jgi:Gnt-I system high-affinity gluconate transporter
MALITVFLCIVLLVILITWAKLNPFLAFLIVSVIAGILLGMPLNKVSGSVQKGLGDTLGNTSGSLAIIICLGAMLGKLIAVSGAAQKITEVLVKAIGLKHIQWALVVAGFIIGIPLFYGIGFVLVVPLIFSITYKYKLPVVYIGLPMLAALSVTHGFLPPHPSPSALVVLFNANMGLTLIYGLIIAIPTIIVAGPLFAQTLKKMECTPLATFMADEIPSAQLPGGFNSFFTALLPVILLMAGALFLFISPNKGQLHNLIVFISDPSIVMLIALITGTFSVGICQGKNMKQIAVIYADAVKDIALILLIIGGSGAFKQVLTDSGISNEIAQELQTFNLAPLFLGWLIAAIIRISLGSATVAGLTAAGIMLPLAIHAHANPNLMVLAIGAGSLAFSHVNDSGFWMFKEYFNLSIKDTLRSWSVMESIVSVMGLCGVLLLHLFV